LVPIQGSRFLNRKFSMSFMGTTPDTCLNKLSFFVRSGERYLTHIG
jgi:hypothetical protein